MAFKILKKQPRQESGPFTQAQLDREDERLAAAASKVVSVR